MVPVKQSAHLPWRDDTTMTAKHVLDARRLLCPMPLIRLQDFVAGVQGGDLIEVRCTDPGTRNDIPAWCRINGHELVRIEDEGDELVITVRVSRVRGKES